MQSKLCLGTVQFGLKYGINNAIGRQPNKQEVFNVLRHAINAGIDAFDTASVYGNAEKLLGEFGLGKYPVKIVSKLKPVISDNGLDDVVRIVKKSLKNINVTQLDGYLLHDAHDFYNASIVDGLLECKRLGFVKNIGVSIYEPDDAVNVVKSGLIDYIQIPYNVFDQRLNEMNFFALASQYNVKIFARSAFLQGLLVMDINDIPQKMSGAKSYLQLFANIADSHGFSRKEAALLFSYCNPHINKVVFGVETMQQLLDNLKIIQRSGEFDNCYRDLLGRFAEIERRIIMPSLW